MSFDEAKRVCSETVLGEWDETPPAIAREFQAHSRESVFAAALLIEAEVQQRLWDLGGPGTTTRLGWARTVWDAQWQAHAAVRAKTGHSKTAKEIQHRAAGRRVPLTVCVGHRLRRLPEPVLRFNAPDLLEHYGENLVPLGFGDGCGLIIEDGGMGKPGPPKRYCDRCAAKAGRTLNAGLAKNALARLKAARNRG